MNENFERVLNLAQKTNSRLIVFDRTAGKHLVVMGIDEFESLVTEPEKKENIPNDNDADKDHELIQKLNQEIAEWRNKAQKKEAENVIHDFNDLPEEILEEPKSTTEKEAVEKEISEPLNSPAASLLPAASSSWHKFGDVMARYQPAPKMPEIRYEPAETPQAEKTESLDDEQIFFEEPVE